MRLASNVAPVRSANYRRVTLYGKKALTMADLLHAVCHEGANAGGQSAAGAVNSVRAKRRLGLSAPPERRPVELIRLAISA